jgi:hypothetical protein
MLSLAAWRYRGIFADRGGPISQVESSVLPVFDRSAFQAAAFLQKSLTQKSCQPSVASAADGEGSAEDPKLAENLAISEALERWAFHETRKGSPAQYGFEHDRSSTGIAAYPGFSWQARRRARLQALERFALVGWWDRQLNGTVHHSPYPGVGLVRIDHQQAGGEVVVLYHRAPAGFVSYGHAAGSSLATATSRAVVRLVRSEFLISRRRACGRFAQPVDGFERRCLYFSSAEGHAEFLQRVASKARKPPPKWRSIFDGEIPGPWSKWTTVWRHCVEMPSYDFLDTRLSYFFW